MRDTVPHFSVSLKKVPGLTETGGVPDKDPGMRLTKADLPSDKTVLCV